MFWKATKFALVEEESVVFRDWKRRDNVAQICVLESKCKGDRVVDGLEFEKHRDINGLRFGSEFEENRGVDGLGFHMNHNRLVVGNIHVMFNPMRGEVKLGQVRVFLEKVHAMSSKWGNLPVVATGDFNSTPWSPLYRFLSSSRLDLTGLDRRCISGQEDALEIKEQARRNRGSHSDRHGTNIRVQRWDQFELIAATGGKHLSTLHHKLKLRSAYSEIEGKPGSRDARGEPFVTSFHKSFSGTVDYIWHTDELCAVRVLDTLPLSVLQHKMGLLSQQCASDHLPLACEFYFVPSKRKSGHIISSSELST